MKYEITEKPGACVVAFSGEIDLESSPVAREILIKCFENTRKVIVDLSAVSYIDSSGVASLVEALQAAKKSGGIFILAATSEPIRRVLELARLDKVFTLVESVDEGLVS